LIDEFAINEGRDDAEGLEGRVAMQLHIPVTSQQTPEDRDINR
jgi:hypothetical protein